jgi:HD superfamily phosphohydrolase
MPRTLGDALYGYIGISELERRLLAQPEALRLHRILQQSTLFHTYVNNRGSRFPHSVGAMHVAGRLYDYLHYRLTADHCARLHAAVDAILTAEEPAAIGALFSAPDGFDALYAEHGYTPAHWRDVLLFQGIRLAALVHDIGHPPYSHIVEFALRDADRAIPAAAALKENITVLQERYREITGISGHRGEIHETIGISVTHAVFNTIAGENDITRPFAQAAIRIAATILAADQLGHPDEDKARSIPLTILKHLRPWYLLGQLVSGQVDCDRLDYLCRDPRNNGVVDFGHIDVDRIIRHVGAADVDLTKIAATTITVPAPTFDHRAVSALETFLYERMRQFRWFVCHHNVVRTDTALNRAVFLLIEEYFGDETLLQQTLQARGFADLWEWTDRRIFARTDDAWLDQILHHAHQTLDSLQNRTAREEELHLLLDVFLFRRVERLPSLWKRLDQFLGFAQGVQRYFQSYYERKSPPKWPWPISDARFSELQDIVFATEPVASLDKYGPVRLVYALQGVLQRIAQKRPAALIRIMQAIERTVDDGRYIFVGKPFTAYKRVDVGGADLAEMSSLVRNLNEMWREGLSFFAFDRRPNEEKRDLPEVGALFAKALDGELDLLAQPRL